MLNFFKKIFRKQPPKPTVPRVVARAVPASTLDPNQPRPQVEVAHLSLAAILTKFPDDLKRNVASLPDPSVTVALPLSTIHKQLPSGSVKMSLASLYRQAPVGVFAATARPEDKRMVEVPLSEIFRHVKPQALRRRNDQRRQDLPEDAYELFGDKENPYAIAPAAPSDYEEEEAPAPPPSRGGVRPSGDMSSSVAAPAPAPSVSKGKAKAGPPAAAPKASAGASAGQSDSPLVLPIANLCSGWPEPIRAEAESMGDATVSLPVATITTGVAKGKVTFTWGQIRSWLNPAPSGASQGKDATELVLPLKVVAPAFLAHSRPASTRKKIQLDDSIPALFSGGEAAKPVAPPAPAPAPANFAPPPSIPAPAFEPAPAAEPEPAPVQAEAPVLPPPTPIPSPAPAAAVAPAALAGPRSIGEMLGCEEKPQYSPQELVLAAIGLDGVGGAAIGLHEGLLVAAELPDHLKGDTIAAFLPQMFARLNNYTGEMKLGNVDELHFTTTEAHFQTFKLGEVYLAVLGKIGEPLPSASLRLIADHLAKQNTK